MGGSNKCLSMILYTKGNSEKEEEKQMQKKSEVPDVMGCKEWWGLQLHMKINAQVFEMFNHNTQKLHRTMYTETVHDTKTSDCFNVYTTTKQANLK